MKLQVFVDIVHEPGNGSMTEYGTGAMVNKRSVLSRIGVVPSRLVSARVEEESVTLKFAAPVTSRRLRTEGDVVRENVDGNSIVTIGTDTGSATLIAGSYRFSFVAG
ncbi:MAG: hypothetical protein WC851_03145 [Candidatus Shapirobacteria bacterium]